MWKLYCLPGRVITEFGYLFPGRGQIWASARRRESGCATFIFATGFWIVFWLFAGPAIIGLIGSAVTAIGQNDSTPNRANPAAEGPPAVERTVVHVNREFPIGHVTQAIAAPTVPQASPAPDETATTKPRIVFAAPREVVEPIPADEANHDNTANQ